MTLKELREKIDHARSLDGGEPEALPFPDFPALIRGRRERSEPFLVYRGEDDQRTELSYEQFCELVYNTARFLRAKGLHKGDRIATVSHNHWHTVIHYFAAWLLGLVVVPVNLGEDDERIAYILENGRVELAFVRSGYRERIASVLRSHDSLKHIETVICGEDTGRFTREEGEVDPPEDLAGSEALIVFTSGTTGPPKGVVLSQRNLLEDARSIAGWHDIGPESRMMCVLPIHHVNGTVVTLITPFLAGGSTVLNRRFRTERFLPVIAEEGVEVASMVPTLLQYLNSRYEEREVPDCPDFRHVICGAGPLTVKTARAFEERLGIPVIHGYGLSETTCYSCFLPVDLPEEEHRRWMREYGYPSIGVPVPANEMAIHDEEGNPLGENERGEIVIRGVNVMLGYYNNRDANEETFRHGWFRSGDEGFYIEDGEGRPYFFITGRLKELIIRGGVNLSPLEIDEVINRAPGVEAGIAVGFENKWYGEEVGAYVQPKEGGEADEEAILAYCREHLPFAKAPKVVVFGEQIPVTSTGKYQRRKVTHHFERWSETQFRREE